MPQTSANAALTAKESPEIWHRRFVHLGYDNLARLAAGSMVQGMTRTAAEFKAAGQEACDTCITAKQHNQPRPSSTSDYHKHLELLLTDVCGPQNVPSLEENKYLVAFLDDCSKLAMVRPVMRKSDVPMVITKDTVLMPEKSGHSLMNLRS